MDPVADLLAPLPHLTHHFPHFFFREIIRKSVSVTVEGLETFSEVISDRCIRNTVTIRIDEFIHFALHKIPEGYVTDSVTIGVHHHPILIVDDFYIEQVPEFLALHISVNKTQTPSVL